MHAKYSFTLDQSGPHLVSSYVQSLARYSAGLTSRSQIMLELDIGHYGVLLKKLNSVGLPRPILPAHIRQKMADDLVKVLAQHDKCV